MANWLTSGGTAAALYASIDWARTPLGPIESWPLGLRSYVRLILDLPTPAIIFWGPEQTQLYNEGYAHIMGPRHPRYLGAPFRECWPDTYPVIYPWMRKVLDEGDVVRVERAYFHLTRHGFDEEAYFTFTFSPLRDDAGAIAGIYQPVLEVTGATLAERRADTLRELAVRSREGWSLEHAMGVLERSAKDVPWAALFLREPRGALLLAGRSRLDGVDARRLSRLQSVGERALADDGPVEAADLLQGHPTGPWPEPSRSALALPIRLRQDEPARGVLVVGLSPRLRFDAPYRAFAEGVARELASHLGQEEAHRIETVLLAREQVARREAELQKEHLHALLSQAPVPLAILRGPELVCELVNELACRILHRARADLIDRPLLAAVPELRGQELSELLLRVLASGETIIGREKRAEFGVGPGGAVDELYLDFVYAPLRGPWGQVDGVLVFGMDVTHQVRARHEINELRAEAEEASRAKDEFLAVLGHELRNPLAPILAALHLLRLRGGPRVEHERSVIERHALHLVRLVDDLLDVSRITRGKVALTKVRISLGEAITRALEMVGPLFEQRGQALTLDIAPPAELEVMGDVVRLAQAVSNLLTNASKYTEAGGAIRVQAARLGDHVELRVRDAGVGIDPEMLPRIFDLFVQERQTLDRSQGGLGLGLMIVRSLVTLHGGTVEARSAGRGEGSEFIVRLPAAPAPAALAEATEPAAPRDVGAGQARSILIVDDNVDAAVLLGEILGELGHRTRVVHDGPSALDAARERAPDVALLDIGLPIMDGYELARRLRSQSGDRPLALVAVTGYGQESDRARTRAAGFAAHLVKPIDLDSLSTLITSLAPNG